MNPSVCANFTEFSIVCPTILKELKLAIRDWLSFLNNNPFDAFSTRRSCQRPVVAPEFRCINVMQKGLNIEILRIELFHVLLCKTENRDDLIDEVVIVVATCSSIESNSNHSTQTTTSI